MKYTKTTKQGYKIIAKGYSCYYGNVIVAERKFEERIDYVVAETYEEKDGEWGQGHYMSKTNAAIELFSAIVNRIDWIEYNRKAE